MPDDIFSAAEKGDAVKLRVLLESNPSLVQQFSPDGWTPLHLAAHYGHLGAAELLLSFGADSSLRSKNSLENLPLHAAVAGNHNELVELLVADGCDINARQHGGWTALHGTADNGNLSMVQFLVRNGAFVNVTNDAGLTPLDMAGKKGHGEIVNLLKSDEAD